MIDANGQYIPDDYAGMDMGQWAPPPIEYPTPEPQAAPPPAATPPPAAPPPAPSWNQHIGEVGRWRVGANGAPEWEAGVTAPNQIDPNAYYAAQAQQAAAPPAQTAAGPAGGAYGVSGTGNTAANPYHEAGRTYQAYAGWDTAKLNDPNHQTTKYNFMRTVQQLGLPVNHPNVLATIADYMRNHGYPGAQVVGADRIDFGDGFGPIDVIRDVGGPNSGWAWIHQSQAGVGGGGQVPAPQGSGGLPSVGAGGGVSAGGTQPVVGGAGGGDNIMNRFMEYLNTSGISAYGQGLQNMLLGALQGTDPNTNRRFENAVEMANRARRSQLNNMRGELAARNLLSIPGQAQGLEGLGMGNIEERIAPAFAQELRNISIAEGDRWQELMNMGLDSARQAEANMLGALTGAGQYHTAQGQLGLNWAALNQDQQQFAARLALDYLQSDRNFQQFLAQHGLNVQQLQWEMEHGDRALAQQLTIAYLNTGAGANEGGNEPV